MEYIYDQFKRKNEDFYNIAILISVFTIVVVMIMIITNATIWGSEVDWLSQHFAIPEYFRTRFYKTGDLFPDFAMHLGGGQNIYNFAYYGLMNPLYLPAYLMPWITMAEYIQFISLLSVIVSGIMFYFLAKKHYDSKIAVFLAVMLMCSAPVIFHSHRHVMFVNYFPFLLSAFHAVNGIDNIRNRIILIASSCCILLCSFYFSICALLSVILYSVFISFKKYNKIGLKYLIKLILPHVICIGLGCIIAGMFWIPTFFTLLNGREESSAVVNILNLIIPSIDLKNILYSPYSMGITSIGIIAMISSISSKNKGSKLISAVCAVFVVFPFVMYLLNGTMYIDSKALIPLMPICIILCGEFFTDLFNGKVNIRMTLIIFTATVVSDILLNKREIYIDIAIIVDSALMIIAILVFVKFRKKNIVLVLSALLSIATCVIINSNEEFVPKEKMSKVYSNDIQKLVDNTIASDDKFYRFANEADCGKTANFIFNPDYYTSNVYSSVTDTDFRYFRFYRSSSENCSRNNAIHSQPHNEIFDVLMGCRYRISKNPNAFYGEKAEDHSGEYNLFSNKNVIPIGYATSSVISEEAYNNLNQAEKSDAMLKSIIIPGGSFPYSSENVEKLCSSYSIKGDTSCIKKVSAAYEIESNKKFSVSAKFDNPVSEKIILLRFHIDNRIGRKSKRSDVWISVNGIKNKLSDPEWKYNNNNYDFSYVISSDQDINELKFVFSEGNYIVSDFNAYTLDASVIENVLANKDELDIDMSQSGGDMINGTIHVAENGWFNLSVPYDKGFHIMVDGVRTEYYKTNTAFIGFPISSGSHNITIKYKAPWSIAGTIVTFIGLMASMCMLFAMKNSHNNQIYHKKKIVVAGIRYYG